MGTLGGIFLAEGNWPAADPNDPVYQWDLERMTDGEMHGMEGMDGMEGMPGMEGMEHTHQHEMD